jgi:hypothetical protein
MAWPARQVSEVLGIGIKPLAVAMELSKLFRGDLRTLGTTEARLDKAPASRCCLGRWQRRGGTCRSGDHDQVLLGQLEVDLDAHADDKSLQLPNLP